MKTVILVTKLFEKFFRITIKMSKETIFDMTINFDNVTIFRPMPRQKDKSELYFNGSETSPITIPCEYLKLWTAIEKEW